MAFPSLITWACPVCRKTHRSVLEGEKPVALLCPMCGYVCGVRLMNVGRSAVEAVALKEEEDVE